MRRFWRRWAALLAAVLASAMCQAVGIETDVFPSPSVVASSEWVYVETTSTLLVNGTNFNKEYIKLHFDPPLPGDKFRQEVVSSTHISLHKKTRQNGDQYPNVWAFEPGPLKVVAINTGAGVVHLNPEGGGVTVAMMKAEITAQDSESLHIYESTKQVKVAGSGFTEGMSFGTFQVPSGMIFNLGDPEGETIDVTVTDMRRNQLTLNLPEGSTWSKDLYPSILMIRGKGLVGKKGRKYQGKIATVLPDPGIDASDTEIYRTITQSLKITGTGFGRTRQMTSPPFVDFEPPLDSSSLHVHVNSPTEIWLGLTQFQPEWTPAGYFGPLKIKGIDTGAGMVVFDSPITVAIVTQTNTTVVPPPSVEASSQLIYMSATRGFSVHGANFNLFNTKLYFDPPIPESTSVEQKVVSSTEVRLHKTNINGDPDLWALEPGPLKVVAIDTGTGLVHLNPEGGGVVVVVVKADIKVKDNESLYIYQSTKQVKVEGSGFENLDLPGIRQQYHGPLHNVTDVRSDGLTLIQAEGNSWFKDKRLRILPAALRMPIKGFEDINFARSPPIATVFEDPSVGISDIEVYRTCTQQLVIRGNGFNQVARPILDFDPPLDSATLHLNVENHTVMHLGLSRSQPEWASAGYSGPLTIKGIDTGAGMVVLASPVTVATVLPDSDAPDESRMKMTTSASPSPSVAAASFVESKRGYFVLVVEGEQFNHDYTELYFEPPLRTAINKQIVSSTRIVLTISWGNPKDGPSWTLEPGSLKLVAIDTGNGLVYLNPDGGGVVIQNDIPSCTPMVQDNEGLRIYQSTKRVEIVGSCLSDNMKLRFHGRWSPAVGGITTEYDPRSDQLTAILPEKRAWIQITKNRAFLPAPLVLEGVQRQFFSISLDDDDWDEDSPDSGTTIATVLEDPSVNASDIKIPDTHAHVLEITGTGFNMMARPILDFDPPLDMATIDTDVVNSTMIHLRSVVSSGWTPAEGFQGPLTIKGVDTGAGMVVFDSPVTVATFVPLSNPKHVLTEVLDTSHLLVPVVLVSSVALLILWRF